MMKWILPAICLSITVCSAQPDFRFHHYGQSEGLPATGIRDIVEDSDGMIWLATNNGLTSFNGYHFTVFRNANGSQPQLASNDITALYSLNQNDLLVGTTAGLHYFDHRKQRFINYWDSLPPSYISQIIPSQLGGFWIGSSTGLYYLDSIGKIPVPFFPDKSSSLYRTGIFSLYQDNSGHLWITTSRKGFFKLTIQTKELVNYRHQPNDPHSLSSDIMRQMVALPDGRLILGTADAGYNVFDPHTHQFTQHTHQPTNPTSLSSTAAFSLMVDANNNLWVGTWANGLNLIETNTWTGRYFKNNPDNRYSICGNSITTLFESRTGDIWIGTSSTGLSRLSPTDQLFDRYLHDSQRENTLTLPYVKSIYQDAQGDLWFGTHQGGLNRYHPATQDYQVYLRPDESRDALARGTIWSISESTDGYLWLGTSRGVGKLHPTSGKITFLPYEEDQSDPRKLSGNNVLKVLDDHAGSLWVGLYYGGLNRVDLATGVIEKFQNNESDPHSLTSNNTNDIFIDHKNRVWVASDEGLNLLNHDQRNFTRYLNQSEISVFHLNEDKNGLIYAATDIGLVIIDTERATTSIISEAQGLHADHVNSVLIDGEGIVWLAHNVGIDRYDPVKKQFVYFDERTGLCANDSESKSCFQSQSGKLYFGGTGGVTGFDPTKLKGPLRTPRVLFTGLSIFNKAIPVSDSSVLKQSIRSTDRITLNYSDYVFALEFAAPEFHQPHRIRYAYQLDGFDKDWIYTDARDRKAVYTNVPAGTYTLKVRASDIHGEFENEYTKLMVTITPPWWKTWWAQFVLYSSLVLFVLIAFRARVAFMQRQNKLLEEQVAARTVEVNQQRLKLQAQAEALEIANQQKTRLFSIIAHDLRSPLNSLKALLTLLDPGILTSADLDKMKKELGQRVEVISGVMENLLGWAYGQLELEAIRLEKVDVIRIFNEMAELYQPIAGKKDIQILVSTNQVPAALADVNMLRAILRNLTNNAIKFTRSGGVITLLARFENQELIVEVQDTGVGMNDQQLKNLFSIDKHSTVGTGGERGVGLGLQLVHEFVAKLNGRLWVKSQPDVGTTFSFSLPIDLS